MQGNIRILIIKIKVLYSTKSNGIIFYINDFSNTFTIMNIKHIVNLISKIHTCLTVETSITIETFASVCVLTINAGTAIFAMR